LSTKSNNKSTKYYLDFLQYSDGTNSLKKISNIIKLNELKVRKIYKIFKNNNLVY
jgi:aminopeptidase-like protein